MINILIVEDDKDLNHTVCKHLSFHQYQVTGCLNPTEAYECMYSGHYDIIISDIMMPGIDGFEFAEAVRKLNSNIPILFMTAREDFSAKERGFRLGIDDYMVKPINLDELLLHITALLRRANIAAEKKLVIGDLILDENEISAAINGEQVPLTLREFQILFRLLSYPNRTFTRSQLINEFSGVESESGLRTVDVFITNLRSKFSDSSAFKIITVRGLGYKAVIS
ncbi:response regulator transcription factor [Lacrimispora sp. 38-1]|uniref:response regulator transcription factor n=1 Tax=Lacrimispora sp. 38-1 TaxID=3125778 RepID=UPI003CED5F31